MNTEEIFNKIQQEIGYIPKAVITQETTPQTTPNTTQQQTQEVKTSVPVSEPKTEVVTKPRPAHLFKPGQSGNPKGRPKKVIDFDAEIEEELAKIGAIEGANIQITKQQLIIRKMAKKAMDGDVKAAQFLAERIKGRPTQKIVTNNTNLNLNQTIESIKNTKVVEADTPDGTPTEA